MFVHEKLNHFADIALAKVKDFAKVKDVQVSRKIVNYFSIQYMEATELKNDETLEKNLRKIRKKAN